ncbi:hypothetical protein B5808_13825 [Cnuibacter physcomitrellae]|uniref:GNAT family N-acetyltransferase n=1 Tax=Cnuibacter physcomitrellae TaxID=1619308 RepID=A0A1X9LM41_9MICO|nr:hypothetical protein [Cnuibacter physcomitrellae]ARJ06177.1 hypothetical protein B5808_13825 [Cnuibacter physcomitrellae]MCS5496039.1 hypothetical protein [Cnuibacter physcomitrellae]
MFRSSNRSDDVSLIGFASVDPVSWVDASRLRDGFATGSYRREWTWLAEIDDRPVARAVWWGPSGAVHPLALHCVIVDPTVPNPELWAAALIRSAHRAYLAAGAVLEPDVVIHARPGWRDDPVATAAVSWRMRAALDAGLALASEAETADGRTRIVLSSVPGVAAVHPVPVPSGPASS